MVQSLKVWFGATIVFVILDMLWLSVFMSGQYSDKLGFLAHLKDGKIQFNLPIGLLTQVIIITGLVLILLRLFQKTGSLPDHLLYGGIMAFTIYATYDLTNLSFVKNWPINITIIDILWGTFQGFVAGFMVWFLRR